MVWGALVWGVGTRPLRLERDASTVSKMDWKDEVLCSSHAVGVRWVWVLVFGGLVGIICVYYCIRC